MPCGESFLAWKKRVKSANERLERRISWLDMKIADLSGPNPGLEVK